MATAHNEDGEPWFADQMFLLVASYSPELKTSDYFALCYPGQLAGNVFGFNSHGLAFVATRVGVQETRNSGIATSFALRDLLAADSEDDAQSVFASKEHVRTAQEPSSVHWPNQLRRISAAVFLIRVTVRAFDSARALDGQSSGVSVSMMWVDKPNVQNMGTLLRSAILLFDRSLWLRHPCTPLLHCA
jgi:hypothetical protein